MQQIICHRIVPGIWDQSKLAAWGAVQSVSRSLLKRIHERSLRSKRDLRMLPAILRRMSFLRDFQQLSRSQRHAFIASFSRLDPRQPGLLSPDLLRPGDRIRFPHKAVCCARCCLSDPGISSAGGFDFRHARRSLWASPGADPQYSWLLGHRTHMRLCTNIEHVLVLRAMFGIAMGGEWGVGAALVFETLPKEGRGTFSGILQEGYALDRSSRPLPSRPFPVDRLARNVHGRGEPGFTRPLCAGPR